MLIDTLSSDEADEQMNGEGATELARVLSNLTELTSLNLYQKNIGDEGATALARVLESNATLKTLDLVDNLIGDEGAMALARVLESNATLKELHLDLNSIGNEGATALARALESNTTLKELHLDDNLIGKKGATALARVLESNTTLETLDLGNNSIGDEGATALLETLQKYNGTLKNIDLSWSKSSVRKQICDLVEMNDQGARSPPPAPRPRIFSPPNSEPVVISESDITNNDILCGGDFDGSTHQGNVAYRRATNWYKGQNESLRSQGGLKESLIYKILHEFVDGGSHFVKKSQDGNFVLLTKQEAREKLETDVFPDITSAHVGGHNQQQEPFPQEEESNNAPRFVKHKRADVTRHTDAASALMRTVIEIDELQYDVVIGRGGFGKVWKAAWHGTPVAVKELKGWEEHDVPTNILQEFTAEINMLKGMHHPNICRFMGKMESPLAIITEFASNGSLWNALRKPLPFVVSDGTTRTAWPLQLYPDRAHGVPPTTEGTWPWALIKEVACGAARGMTYLHGGSPPVLHRDLKSPNLLVDENYTCKVCDFGLSRLKDHDVSMTKDIGTTYWKAPEILNSQRYGEPADVYSFGIVLWEMLTRECPYKGMGAIQCGLAVLTRDLRPVIPVWCPPSLADLIRKCWDREPANRPTFPQVLADLEAMP